MAARNVAVLMYHAVGAAKTPWEKRYCVSPHRFEQHLDAVIGAGYYVCTLAEFCLWWTGRSPLPPHSVLFTFDDGYRGVYQYAAPVLLSKKLSFAVFVVTAALGESDTWLEGVNEERSPLMTLEELRELAAAGVGIGSHSRHHADLPTLSSPALLDEIGGSRSELEKVLGQPVECFAYPYGRANHEVRNTVAQCGYRYAFSTRSGLNRRDADPFMIRRIDVYGTDTPAMLLRKLQFGTNDGSLLVAGRYYARRAAQRLGFY